MEDECENCNGTGWLNASKQDDPDLECSECNGLGWINDPGEGTDMDYWNYIHQSE